MNANQQPQGSSGVTPPAPVAVQQTTVIQVGTHKSVVGAVLLAFFFGPLGMLYVTVPGAIVMFFINLIVGIPTLGLGLIVTVPIGAVWAGIAADSQNKRLRGVAAQQVVAAPAAPAPPAVTPPAAQPVPLTNAIEQPSGEVDVVLRPTAPVKATCGSCGREIEPRARFCSACGAAQATA